MNERDETYCYHIIECITLIEQHASEGKDAFDNNIKTHDAIIYRLQTMSESTKRLSNELKESITEIPWDIIAGFRNRLVHDYLGLDDEVIWNVIHEYLPELKLAMQRAMEKKYD